MLFFVSLSLYAHEVRPAYFSVTQQSEDTYQIVWKVPAMGTGIPKIYPVLPNSWESIDEQSNLLPGNLRRTYTVKVGNEIEGNTLYFKVRKKR